MQQNGKRQLSFSEFLQESGVSYRAAAAQTGLPPMTIHHLADGSSLGAIRRFKTIADTFGLDMSELLAMVELDAVNKRLEQSQENSGSDDLRTKRGTRKLNHVGSKTQSSVNLLKSLQNQRRRIA